MERRCAVDDGRIVLLVRPVRFLLRARDSAFFPQGTLTDGIRGAFGFHLRRSVCDPLCSSPASCPRGSACPYVRIFEPRGSSDGPSGLRDSPRPFVLRGESGRDLRLEPGESFSIDVHLFDVDPDLPGHFEACLSEFVERGLGVGRPRIELTGMSPVAEAGPCVVELDLTPQTRGVEALRLHFRTPMEIKGPAGVLREPRFDALLARARDRIANLRHLYQGERLPMDFAGLGERARAVRMVRSSIVQTKNTRVGGHTGRRHPMGGFMGYADYEGPLDEFIPILEAARWTGIGRHAVWGWGAIELAY